MERLPHIIETQQFTVDWLEEDFFPLVDEMEELLEKREEGKLGSPLRTDLADKNVSEFFYGASTRTMTTFLIAAREMGATSFSTDNASISSSAVKGESLEDSIKILSGYRALDLIALRTPISSKEEEMKKLKVKNAVPFSTKPIINAGDRDEQHPTQTLIDLYTIKKQKGAIAGLKIGLGGDIGGSRTAKSLIYLATKYQGVQFGIISPELSRISDDLRDYLKRHKVKFIEDNDARKYAHTFDVYYVVRVQTENDEEGATRKQILKYGEAFWAANNELLNILPKDAIILDPLPRTQVELPYETDKDPRAVYFKQAQYGESVRMALLLTLLKEPYRTTFLQKTNPLSF